MGKVFDWTEVMAGFFEGDLFWASLKFEEMPFTPFERNSLTFGKVTDEGVHRDKKAKKDFEKTMLRYKKGIESYKEITEQVENKRRAFLWRADNGGNIESFLKGGEDFYMDEAYVKRLFKSGDMFEENMIKELGFYASNALDMEREKSEAWNYRAVFPKIINKDEKSFLRGENAIENVGHTQREKILTSVKQREESREKRVKIEINNTNNVSEKADIDLISDQLTQKLCEIMAKSSDGIYF